MIGTKVSGRLDMLAIGPQIEAPHSPDERVSIPTVERFWKLLVGIVDEFSAGKELGDARTAGLDRRDRRRRRCVVIVVTAMVGNRDKSGETVPAGEWAQSTCGAVAVWRGEIESIVEDIRTPNASSTAGGEEPQSETPQGRTGFVRKGLERAVQATETHGHGDRQRGHPGHRRRARRQPSRSPTGPTPRSTTSRRHRTRSTRKPTPWRTRSSS